MERHEQHYKERVSMVVVLFVESIVSRAKEWGLNACGLDIPGHVGSEMLHHVEWARAKVDGFFGREDLMSSLKNAVFSEASISRE